MAVGKGVAASYSFHFLCLCGGGVREKKGERGRREANGQTADQKSAKDPPSLSLLSILYGILYSLLFIASIALQKGWYQVVVVSWAEITEAKERRRRKAAAVEILAAGLKVMVGEKLKRKKMCRS